MALKQYKPNTPGQRGLVLVDKSDLYKGKPVKRLTEGLNKSGGRNNSGKITSGKEVVVTKGVIELLILSEQKKISLEQSKD